MVVGKVESVADEEEERFRQNLESWAREPRGQICENANKKNGEGADIEIWEMERFVLQASVIPKQLLSIPNLSCSDLTWVLT